MIRGILADQKKPKGRVGLDMATCTPDLPDILTIIDLLIRLIFRFKKSVHGFIAAVSLLLQLCDFSVSGIIQNLEEESNTNKYMVADVHPKEIAALKKAIQNLQKIVTEPAMGQSDLDVINQKVNYSIYLLYYNNTCT
jgi:hypothetical protein